MAGPPQVGVRNGISLCRAGTIDKVVDILKGLLLRFDSTGIIAKFRQGAEANVVYDIQARAAMFLVSNNFHTIPRTVHQRHQEGTYYV